MVEAPESREEQREVPLDTNHRNIIEDAIHSLSQITLNNGLTSNNGQEHEDANNGREQENEAKAPAPGQGLSKSAKRRRKKRARDQVNAIQVAKKRVTGFEEYFCDGPLTLAHHNSEKDIYSTKRDPAERMQSCIAKWKEVRNLIDDDREHIFVAYLNCGGLSTGESKFGSRMAMYQSAETDEEFRKKHCVELKEVVTEGEIDFLYVVRLFLYVKVQR